MLRRPARVPGAGLARSLLFVAAIVATSLAALAAIAFPTPAASAQEGPRGDNDAASGQDAGNSPDAALPLALARRTWSANLTPPGTDSDWYRLEAGASFCATGEATSNAPGELVLAARVDRSLSVSRSVAPHNGLTLALAAPAGGLPLLGLEPAPTISTAAGGGTRTIPNPGRYTFSFETRGLAELDPEGDGETPDAGPTGTTAAPLPVGCSAGMLGGADAVDAYAADVGEPRLLTISFVVASGGPAPLRVVSPSGATVATLASGEAADVWASEPGRWTVVVGSSAGPALPLALPLLAAGDGQMTIDTTYVLGVTDGPGDPQPCRPSCVG